MCDAFIKSKNRAGLTRRQVLFSIDFWGAWDMHVLPPRTFHVLPSPALRQFLFVIVLIRLYQIAKLQAQAGFPLPYDLIEISP
jgi:hypothetical protein